MKRKHKSRTLVLGYLERISSKAFSDFSRQLTELVGKVELSIVETWSYEKRTSWNGIVWPLAKRTKPRKESVK